MCSTQAVQLCISLYNMNNAITKTKQKTNKKTRPSLILTYPVLSWRRQAIQSYESSVCLLKPILMSFKDRDEEKNDKHYEKVSEIDPE